MSIAKTLIRATITITLVEVVECGLRSVVSMLHHYQTENGCRALSWIRSSSSPSMLCCPPRVEQSL